MHPVVTDGQHFWHIKVILVEKISEGEESLVLFDVVVERAHQRGAVVEEESHIHAVRAGLRQLFRAFHGFSGTLGGQIDKLLQIHSRTFSRPQRYNFYGKFQRCIAV